MIDLDVSPADRVLDLGCGPGTHVDAIAESRPAALVAMDLSHAALKEARGRARAGEALVFVRADALALPFADGIFDRVICALVMYLLPIEPALREMHRVMRPGAIAYLRVPMLAWNRMLSIVGAGDPRSAIYAAAHLVSGVLFAVTGTQRQSLLMRNDRWAMYVPQARLCEALARIGFEIRRLEVVRGAAGASSMEVWVAKTR